MEIWSSSPRSEGLCLQTLIENPTDSNVYQVWLAAGCTHSPLGNKKWTPSNWKHKGQSLTFEQCLGLYFVYTVSRYHPNLVFVCSVEVMLGVLVCFFPVGHGHNSILAPSCAQCLQSPQSGCRQKHYDDDLKDSTPQTHTLLTSSLKSLGGLENLHATLCFVYSVLH